MKIILLIYYNPNRKTFYYRTIDCGIELLLKDYYVGKKNAYKHELIQILLLDNGKQIDIKDFEEYSVYYNQKNNNSKNKIKNDLIDKIISLLNRLKSS